MISAALRAVQDLFSPPFRTVLLKSVGLTAFVLIVVFIVAAFLIRWLVAFGNPWIESGAEVLATLGILFGVILLAPPTVALVASLFLDDIAETVERVRYPHDPPGHAPPILPSLLLSARFFGLVVVLNLLALPLLFVPVVNIFVFVLLNGYLLGREYFELAAFRHHRPAEARALRGQHATSVFLAGLLTAGLLAIPIVNLTVPLFATALMVHLHKRIARRHERTAARVL